MFRFAAIILTLRLVSCLSALYFSLVCRYIFAFISGTSSAYTRGSTPLYKPYRYVPPHRVGFLHRFGLKTGIHFTHFGLESGVVFEGTTKYINVFIILIPNEKERMRNMRIQNGFE